MSASEKLTSSSKEVLLLQRKLEDGDISVEDNPKSIWASEPTFMQHKLGNFRTCSNKLKKEVVDEAVYSVSPNGLKRPATIDLQDRKKRVKAPPAVEETDSEEEDLSEAKGCTKPYNPITLKSIWEDPSRTIKSVSVAILLPSGVERKDVSARVREGGRELQLTIRWPAPILSVEKLHRKWISEKEEGLEKYHPKIVWFEVALKALRERKCDDVESVALIPLPFPVETHIVNLVPLGWKDRNARVVFVDMRAHEEHYVEDQRTGDFEISS